MRDENLEGKRAALYIRVSTEEQALRGYSLEAQLADLEAFAKEHFMIAVDRYIDAGTTARKKLKNRKEFQNLLDFVEENRVYDTGEHLIYGDTTIMLSTCEYTVNNGRLVVIAKRI